MFANVAVTGGKNVKATFRLLIKNVYNTRNFKSMIKLLVTGKHSVDPVNLGKKLVKEPSKTSH